jgi:hypothetical protein
LVTAPGTAGSGWRSWEVPATPPGTEAVGGPEGPPLTVGSPPHGREGPPWAGPKVAWVRRHFGQKIAPSCRGAWQ